LLRAVLRAARFSAQALPSLDAAPYVVGVMLTITARAEIDTLFRQGRRVTKSTLAILAERTPEARGQDGRVLFVAGKKLGNAVVRNRSRRVMRETVRRAGGPWPGWDVAVIARAATRSATPQDLDAALKAALKAAGIAG